MLTQKKITLGRSISLSFITATILTMSGVAFAAKNLVQDRRISFEQAQTLAQKAQADSAFPIVVNDLVLKQLNRFIGTPEGRDYMHSALQRMQGYQPMIEGKIRKYHLPSELMAIPIIESGYQNLEQTSHAGWGAGLWMFIVPTARAFGLTVDKKTDERLDPQILTDAAMRYLSSNQLRFRDWNLAILAYNIGEASLQKAIDKNGTRDAWDLIRAGSENDRDYLPKVMAAILILKNPEVIQ